MSGIRKAGIEAREIGAASHSSGSYLGESKFHFPSRDEIEGSSTFYIDPKFLSNFAAKDVETLKAAIKPLAVEEFGLNSRPWGDIDDEFKSILRQFLLKVSKSLTKQQLSVFEQLNGMIDQLTTEYSAVNFDSKNLNAIETLIVLNAALGLAQ